ncbi:MAG: glycosyltransferase family 4 protein [Acidobacteriaceae bacterium]|nr:glycosyltransferase family 4 protein [Acidobacteriaceae bacterium]
MKQTTFNPSSKAVIVHRGARDAYQVSRALAEAGLLESLVTDLYWPQDREWAKALTRLLPTSIRHMLMARYTPGLRSSLVRWCYLSGPLSFLLDKTPGVPFSRRQRAQRWTDAALGSLAGRLAKKTNAKLLSYSYYGYHAFSAYRRPGILFQVHPHPASVRRLLQQELAAHPECRASLEKEWELALPEEDFQRLTRETEMAAHFICASSFTRKTLIENGTSAKLVDVVPYGIDLQRFRPALPSENEDSSGVFRLLFVGTINQRKGIKYLLETLRLLRSKQIKLIVCGRVVDDLKIFGPFGSQVEIRPSVSFPELLRAYQEADLFVFPSVVEGFAQVLLEALSCGLPILSTTHTAAPDLIEDGIHGFVVEPRRPELMAGKIEWLVQHRSQLREMKHAARERAEQFTWDRFRKGIVASVQSFQSVSSSEEQERLIQHV